MRVHRRLRAPPPMSPTPCREPPGIPRVGEREGDALHDGAREVRAGTRLRQAEGDAARVRIVVRRALAREIGQEEHRAGAAIIRWPPPPRGGDLGAEQAAGEGERRRAVEHRRHAIPAPGQRVGEAVHELFGRGVDSRRRRVHWQAVPSEIEGVARPDRAERDRADRRVAAARAPRRLARQAEHIRDFGAQPAGFGRAFEQPRRLREALSRSRRAPAPTRRAASSSHHEPAASLMSVAFSPVSARRSQSFGREHEAMRA